MKWNVQAKKDRVFILLRADPIWSVMFDLMGPHLKRYTDQHKHIQRRVMRQTKYLKIMLLKEIAILILKKRQFI